MRQELFSFEQPSIEEIARRLANIYKGVRLSREPLFAWVQMTNDVTILGEDLRRGKKRDAKAIDRAGNVMWRLLEFIGYYQFAHEANNSAGDLVKELLIAPSHTDIMPGPPVEGPSRWILAKYPKACSKCGASQCNCVLYPWTMEDRREDPHEYMTRFLPKSKEAKDALAKTLPPLTEFTLATLFEHFRSIYRHTYYNQEPWKIGMHLSEEVGEATTELSRIDLAWRAKSQGVPWVDSLEEAFRAAGRKLREAEKQLAGKKSADVRLAKMQASLDTIQSDLRKKPFETFTEMVGPKFKEEIADIFSWLAAIITALDNDYSTFRKLPDKFAKVADVGGGWLLGCPWCAQPECTNRCLLGHSIALEVGEKIGEF